MNLSQALTKALGVPFSPNSVDGDPALPDTGRQAREVAVAGDQAEAVETVGVEQVHGVDDHGAVGGVLAYGVVELLDGWMA